jgi:hypothetical protein
MIEKLEPNKSVYFYTDYNKTDELVRTGVPSNLSFIHSVLFLTATNYGSMTDAERNKIAEDLYSLTQPGPTQDKMVLKIKFLNKLKIAYNDTSSSVDPDDLQACIVFFQMISFIDFKTLILPLVMNSELDFKKALLKETENFHRKKFNALTPHEKKSIGLEKIERCISKLTKIIEKVFNEINAESDRQPSSFKLTKDIVKKISDNVDRDIYFISPERAVYTMHQPKKRKSIIIVNIGDDDYEPVSKLLQTKKIQREFKCDEGIITRFASSLVY